MKTSLWVVVVVLVGIVGLLVGYSSAPGRRGQTGSSPAGGGTALAPAQPAATPAASGGYGPQSAPAQKTAPAAGGYGSESHPAQKKAAEAGGYGAGTSPPAKTPSVAHPPAQKSAAGY